MNMLTPGELYKVKWPYCTNNKNTKTWVHFLNIADESNTVPFCNGNYVVYIQQYSDDTRTTVFYRRKGDLCFIGVVS